MSGIVIISIETMSVPGERTAPAMQESTIATRRNLLSAAGRGEPERRQDDEEQRQLRRDPHRQQDLEHEAEPGVVREHQVEGAGLEREQHGDRLRHHEDPREARHPSRKSTSPANSDGTSAFRSFS